MTEPEQPVADPQPDGETNGKGPTGTSPATSDISEEATIAMPPVSRDDL